jgi:hypothetical protein
VGKNERVYIGLWNFKFRGRTMDDVNNRNVSTIGKEQ